MTKESKTSILGIIDTKTKVLALITLVAEALFLGSLFKLPAEQTLFAMIVCACVLVITIVGITIVQALELRSKDHNDGVHPSDLTPDSNLLNELINGAMNTVCRAVSLPQTPESAQLRAFLFRKDGNQLVCCHYWAPNPVKEMVGKLRFDINARVAIHIAVVRALIDEEICRTSVDDIPNDLEGISGEVSQDLRFVLAAPIRNKDGSIWGVVDFDAGNEVGRALLMTEVSDAVMYQLAEHIRSICSLPEGTKVG